MSVVASVLRFVDPRVAWRQLQAPLPAEEEEAARAKALRSIARVVFFLAMGALAIFSFFFVMLGLALTDLGFVADLQDAVMAAALYAALLFMVTLVVRPFTAAYERQARGPGLPRVALASIGLVCLLLALAGPILLVVAIFLIHFASPYPIVASFLVTLASPWLARSGWLLLKP